MEEADRKQKEHWWEGIARENNKLGEKDRWERQKDYVTDQKRICNRNLSL